jgi:hypothetical protein
MSSEPFSAAWALSEMSSMAQLLLDEHGTWFALRVNAYKAVATLS